MGKDVIKDVEKARAHPNNINRVLTEASNGVACAYSELVSLGDLAERKIKEIDEEIYQLSQEGKDIRRDDSDRYAILMDRKKELKYCLAKLNSVDDMLRITHSSFMEWKEKSDKTNLKYSQVIEYLIKLRE